jgi:hypothetical protein
MQDSRANASESKNPCAIVTTIRGLNLGPDLEAAEWLVRPVSLADGPDADPATRSPHLLRNWKAEELRIRYDADFAQETVRLVNERQSRVAKAED